mmetsp:Transcript_12070/g.20420  ORF Transcript_12070/g.20420 Transcript_12070/m.20420 type:complete len:225 (+) Transcript_12070:282-956(+)
MFGPLGSYAPGGGTIGKLSGRRAPERLSGLKFLLGGRNFLVVFDSITPAPVLVETGAAAGPNRDWFMSHTSPYCPGPNVWSSRCLSRVLRPPNTGCRVVSRANPDVPRVKQLCRVRFPNVLPVPAVTCAPGQKCSELCCVFAPSRNGDKLPSPLDVMLRAVFGVKRAFGLRGDVGLKGLVCPIGSSFDRVLNFIGERGLFGLVRRIFCVHPPEKLIGSSRVDDR